MIDRIITREEYRVLKLFKHNKKVPMSTIENVVGTDFCKGVLHDLNGIIVREKLGFREVQSGLSVNYSDNYVLKNPYERKKVISAYWKDLIRTWYPHVVSTVAIILSIIAIIR